jgi:NAD(P)H-dependent FMN reductase
MSTKNKLFIPVILGTNRENRRSEAPAKMVLGLLKNHPRVTTKLIDVSEFTFPQIGYGQDVKNSFKTYKQNIIKADGLVIVSPEYNHGYPGSLKSLLDILYHEYRKKAVGLVGVSNSLWGGVRVIEQLVPVVRELGLVPSSVDLHFPRVSELFDEQGKFIGTEYEKRINRFMEELIWLTEALKLGREKIEHQL